MAEFLKPPFNNVIHTALSFNTNGVNAIVGAPGAGHRIRVVELVFVVTSAVSVTLRSAATDLSGAMPFAANSGPVWSLSNMLAPIDMADNEAFNIFLSSGVLCAGWMKHVVATV